MNYQVLVWESVGGELYENQPAIKTSPIFDCYLEAEAWGEAECQGKGLAYTIFDLALF